MHILLFFVRCLSTLREKRSFYRYLFAVTAVAAFVLSGAVRAGAEEEKLPDRFGIKLGGYAIQNADTVLRLDAANAPFGTYVDFRYPVDDRENGRVLPFQRPSRYWLFLVCLEVYRFKDTGQEYHMG